MCLSLMRPDRSNGWEEEGGGVLGSEVSLWEEQGQGEPMGYPAMGLEQDERGESDELSLLFSLGSNLRVFAQSTVLVSLSISDRQGCWRRT